MQVGRGQHDSGGNLFACDLALRGIQDVLLKSLVDFSLGIPKPFQRRFAHPDIHADPDVIRARNIRFLVGQTPIEVTFKENRMGLVSSLNSTRLIGSEFEGYRLELD
jgi:hypothetical protein